MTARFAMVLAAGRGERMIPLTDVLPKPLLPIANRPVMAYILEHLARHGFTDVIANVWYRAQDIVDCFGDGSRYGVRLSYAHEDKLWGSAGSVKRNEPFFQGERFLVIGADDLTNMDLTELVRRHLKAKALASIGLTEVEETSQFGIVVTDKGGRIERFVEKPKGPAPSNTANTQIYLFEPRIHSFIPPGEWYDFGYNVFPELVGKGEPFYGFALPGYWRDIGSLEGYLAAQWDIMRGDLGLTIPGEEREPHVWIGAGAEIHETANISPPAVIGAGCRIGAGACIGGATAVADGVAVPPGASLWNCCLWEGARVAPDERLSNAVVGPDGVIAQAAETRPTEVG
ncbi:MAG: sugar phosphate nucleotidyltransferase [Armatimonadota bacterium]